MKSRLKMMGHFVLRETNEYTKETLFDHLELGPPISLTNNRFNTSVSLKARKDKPGFTGCKIFNYNRQPLSSLFNYIKLETNITTFKEARDVLYWLNNKFKLDFDEEDFDVLFLEDRLKIKAKPNNYIYTGDVDIKHAIDVSDIVLLKLEPPIIFEEDKINASIYSLGLGATDNWYLQTLHSHSVLDAELLSIILSTYSGDNWVNNNVSTSFNVNNAKVSSVTSYNLGQRDAYKVSIELDPALNENFYNNLEFVFDGNQGEIISNIPFAQRLLSRELFKLKIGSITGENEKLLRSNLTKDDIEKIGRFSDYFIAYNGEFKKLPPIYFNYVTQLTDNVCVILSQRNASQPPIILHY